MSNSKLLVGERGVTGSLPSGSEVEWLPSQQRSTGSASEAGGAAVLQKGKIQHVLSELKVSSLSVSESLKKRVIGVVRECIDSFAATPNDFGRTSVITHTIKTGEAKPFRHKLATDSVRKATILGAGGRATLGDRSDFSCGSRRLPVRVENRLGRTRRTGRCGCASTIAI